MKKTLLAALLVVSSAGAFAADWASTSNLYGGVNVGRSDLRNFNGAAIAPGVTADNNDTSYGVNLGYQFDPALAAQLGYTKLGDYDTSVGSVDSDAWDLSLVARHNFNEQFALTGKIGAAHTKARFAGQSDSKTTPVYGFGGEYSLNKNVALTANWDRYHNFANTNYKLDNISLGMKYKFQ